MAVSAIIVVVLSVVVFAGDGCTVYSILIIILALINDVSMLPVAYDNADATAKPQLPNTTKLILTSLYYGIVHSVFLLGFLFGLGKSDNPDVPLTQAINFQTCNLNPGFKDPTGGFIWLHLLIVTELAIFSVRAPSLFFLSMPSPWLIVSVVGTCIVMTIVAHFALNVDGWSILWIWVFNLVSFVLVDIGKIWFRRVIGDPPGEIIESDELIEVKAKNEVEIHEEKKQRYEVHKESILDPSEFDHPEVDIGGLFNVRNFEGVIHHKQPGARLTPMRGSIDTGRRRYKTVSAPEIYW